MEYFCYHRDRPGRHPVARGTAGRAFVFDEPDYRAGAYRDELIAYGPLLSDDSATWLGTAVLLRAPDPDAARAVLTAGRYADIEVHDWEFGGRR
ncbi:hypothetical protein [Streptomyces caniscabiei]|uniref:hypothetical protein n=1 Tax=Streptomyces caniscabiei TaxID=2746961 RepID=UPI000765C192|nr:hypothetical protein [Streptomyces caniscabiei]